MDWATLTPWLCQSLNAPDVAELQNWTEAELYQFAEEALHDIGGRFICIAEDDTTPIVADQTMYALPEHHIVTIYAAADGVMLKPTTSAEMEALDDGWQDAASGTPTRWIGNVLGLGFVGIYPPSDASGVLTLVFQKHPPDMPVSSPLNLDIPAPVGDYLAVKALEQARLRQGDAQILDASAAFKTLGYIYEKAFSAYWGGGS